MKKIYLSVLILAATVFTASAQLAPTFQFGLKGGANFATINDISLSSSTRTGYQFGVWTRLGAAGLHVQPELYVTSKGASLKGDDGKINLTSLDLPILLGTRIGLGPIAARIQAGPIVSFVIDDESKFGDAIGEVWKVKEYKNQSFGLTGGVGVDIMKLRADLRYEHGLSDVYKGDNGKMSLWTLSIGYRLF